MVNDKYKYPDSTSASLAKFAQALHERYIKYIPDLKRRYPFHLHADAPDMVGVISRVTKSEDGSIYTCYFRDQYKIEFSKGRFAPGTSYTRDPPVVSDRSIIRSIEEDYINSGTEPLTKTRKITKSTTRSKSISTEKVFRALASIEAGVEIKFFSAGGKTEAEYTTTSSEADGLEQTDIVEEEIPIIIPPKSTLRYTEIAERVTSRQTLRAKGIMDWNIHIDIYNLISIDFDSLEQLHLFFTGLLNKFPFGKVSLGDTRRLLYGFCRGETNVKPPAVLRDSPRINDIERICIQEVILRTDKARTGITKLEPLT